MPTDSLTQSLAQSLLSELLKANASIGHLEEHKHEASRRLDRLELHQSELSFEMRSLRASMRPQSPSPPAPSATPVQKPTGTRSTDTKTAMLRRGRRFFPRMATWLAEKVAGYALPYLAPLLLSGWALLHSYGAALWRWLMLVGAMF